MNQPNDQYGRTITSVDNGNGYTTWTVTDQSTAESFTLTRLSTDSIDSVYETINAMAPS